MKPHLVHMANQLVEMHLGETQWDQSDWWIGTSGFQNPVVTDSPNGWVVSGTVLLHGKNTIQATVEIPEGEDALKSVVKLTP